jgi:hypothetical protein
MSILGIRKDLIELRTVWLKNRSIYVNVDGKQSRLPILESGTVLGQYAKI